jgi:endonuclease/exonuclease/phosphatase family metal-dependent hydrolase
VKFTAVTFNMQFGQVWDEADPDHAPIRLDETIEFLRELDADILLLQEVERAQPGGEQPWPPPNFMRLKESLPEYHSVFSYPRANPDELPFGIGLTIFSRTPLVDFTAEDLPPPPVEFEFEGRAKSPSHRQIIAACTTIAGRTIQLFNTHLQAFFMINSSSNEHREQRDGVEQALRRSQLPTLIGGDFNCAPDEDVVAQFGDAGYVTAQEAEPTWRRQPYILDHLFFNSGLNVRHCEVIPTLCSDHHALVAEFRIVH